MRFKYLNWLETKKLMTEEKKDYGNKSYTKKNNKTVRSAIHAALRKFHVSSCLFECMRVEYKRVCCLYECGATREMT